MKYGFTGTKKGMTEKQKMAFLLFIDKHKWPQGGEGKEYWLEEFHNGDCVGADAEAYNIVKTYFNMSDIGYIHPPKKTLFQAWVAPFKVRYTPKDYIKRDRDIVDASDVLIACPRVMWEELRSGTWTTIRYAKKKEKPVYMIWPNGDNYFDFSI